MENAISSFDLEILAQKHDIRIWFCKKTGRRWSFIVGAGDQRPLPSELIYEAGDLGFFVQGESFDEIRLVDEIKELIARKNSIPA
jgi:hypothetical protein